jgi:hypothetical protein
LRIAVRHFLVQLAGGLLLLLQAAMAPYIDRLTRAFAKLLVLAAIAIDGSR